ncbi:hypothetical protein [Nitratireductor sp. GCM10026969]|uniref:hypothetical protein n=1 Tax=Nitratireductor sp. GCM10026969 TaxID=3252645 RepID=UPI003621D656
MFPAFPGRFHEPSPHGETRKEEMKMSPIARSYTIHLLPACTDWKGNIYPDRYGVTLTLAGNPMRADGGEYPTRDEAVAAGQRAVSGA